MKHGIARGFAVAFCATTVSLAQAPQPSADRARLGRTATREPMTIVGCLQREEDVAGREANRAERAGFGDDFVLTNATMEDSAAEGARDRRAPARSAPDSESRWTMLRVTGLETDTLRAHLNRRVAVAGPISGRAAAMRETVETPENQPGTRAGTQQQEPTQPLPEIAAASMRDLGSCEESS
jgi:hypothetical protein